METWKVVEKHPDYAVSDLGRIKRLTGGKGTTPGLIQKLRPWRGYQRCKLNGVFYCVHHIVLYAFVGPRPEGYVSRHLNDIKDDNQAENLAWGTVRENVMDAIRNGTHRSCYELPIVPPDHKPFLGKSHSQESREKTSKTLRERYGNNTPKA